jgi:hypothetical protein
MDESDLDLDDLLAALQSVASSSDPDNDTDRDPNDDPDNSDFDPNDDPDNVDDPEDVDDDPRSYRDDDDDDDEGDYSRRRTVMLLEKLRSEPDCWTLDSRIAQRIAKAKQSAKHISKANQNMNRIAALRQKTSQINSEMKTDQLLAAETKKHQEASVAFYLANLTPEEKREHGEDMRRIAEHYSAIGPEASPDWREQERADFQNKRLS